ncbi:Vacuolar ATPase assembly integral membrane protein VMA21-like protein [Niveomyces insectorum RCEF 264]|uniref:Vacuolar ATPase assembly integral membrane protein VMA21-like protein n=1 Tax=Niveomyces insectorum RCEF 264 TaxID=1081102 RepID=A0A167TVX5_9HYPO|nr:Vacuolar ATPase assembly integral membrane protein VMA21-like protein [Niveomyces insectorum RCEF 264]
MATRRLVAADKASRAVDDRPAAPSVPASAASDNVVPRGVIAKLLGFTLMMVVAPIGSYFATVDALFGGNTTYAGATAAVVANVVLIAYVVVAFREDQAGDYGPAPPGSATPAEAAAPGSALRPDTKKER